ncbi:glycosyl hydrolase [Brachybacterium massiliense]|uniref:glycosyl hydrolase n=1 Tax=Brachybacterium massiliense TaxID=1755098 RepID=UPI001481D793|nr:glycosyl hydrolase [Brachybacterium massiliense]
MHTADQVRHALTHPDPAARPMMRWWWFGPDMDRAEIDRELRAMAEAGLGGAEGALVYPLRPGAPHYLSPEVLAHLRHAAERASELGLRLDVTLGSGWSYGGAHIGAEHAARRLRWERRDLGPAALEWELNPSWPGDELVSVHLGEGLPPTGWQRLPVEGARLQIPVGRGPRTVLLAWSEVTGQQVKRSAAGAEGPVVDHLSAAAVRHHLDTVGGAILEAVPAELLGSVFSDSLEVYDAGWTPGLLEHFRTRRGYELLDVLHLLEVDGPESAQVREDYGRTLSELVEQGFVATCRAWAEEHGVRFRLQGYGQPPITLGAQRGAHLIEGEGAGWTALTQSRWASSAAHLDRREVVSSEVWTWVHSPSFRAAPLDLLAEAHEHLLLGITHFVGHGWPYSAPDAEGLGWTFYAAGALDDRNAWWPAMPELSAHLTRLCAALRLGAPGADVALYLPYADVRAARGSGHDLWAACRAHIGERIPAAIRRAGYDLDLLDDDVLTTLDPVAPAVVILPRVTRLPAEAEAWLDRVRAAGGTVLAVDSPAYPAGIPVPMPVDEYDDGELIDHATLSMVGAAGGGADGGGDSDLAPPLQLSGDGGQVGTVRRRLVGGELHLLANTGPTRRTLEVAPRTPRAALRLLDPADGSERALPAEGGEIDLHPYQALLLLSTEEGSGPVAPADPARSADAPAPLRLEGPWTLTREGEEPRPVALPHLLHGADAADLRPLLLETEVQLDEDSARGPLVLDLGEGSVLPAAGGGSGYRALLDPPVREIAAVLVDGQEVGLLWRPPYRLDLTGRLRAGTTRLGLRIHGATAAAAARPENAEAAAAQVAEAHAAYGERFQQQELDRMLDGVATGLGTVPVLHRPSGRSER